MFSKVKVSARRALSVGSIIALLGLTFMLLNVGKPPDQVHAQGTLCATASQSGAPAALAEVILFVHGNFHGDHKHIFGCNNNLNAADDNGFNDQTSSIIVVNGHWKFFQDSEYQNPVGNFFGKSYIVGPYAIPDLTPFGIPNDSISSMCEESAIDCPGPWN